MKIVDLEVFVKKGNFKKAVEQFNIFAPDSLTQEELQDRFERSVTLGIAFDGNICGYGLACFVDFLNESLDSYVNVCSAVSGGMPYLINAYQAGFARIMRRIERDSSDRNAYVWIMLNSGTPEGELPEDESSEIAEVALSKWPEDEYFKRLVEWPIDEHGKPQKRFFIQKMAEMFARDKRQAFKDLIIQGRFLELRLIRSDFFEYEIDAMLMEIARETYSICAYDYVWHWMRDMRRETAQKHLLMAEMTWFVGINTMSKETTHYDGTKELHFFHIYRAAELEPESIELQEKLLSLYEVDNESFDLDETKVLVDRVLQVSPESEQALRMQKILYSSK